MILLLNMCKVNLFIHKILCRFPFVLEILTKAGRKSGEVSIFLDHVNFQKIEINFFYKIILMKTRLAVPFKLGDGAFQPDRLSQIELQADFFQRVKYLVGACFLSPVLDHGIFYHAVVLKFLCP